MSFADNLAIFPDIENISAILITNSAGNAVDRIENSPSTQGSLKLYKALLEEFGELNATAAKKGIKLFAEYVTDAEANPGKHPNIDRLLAIAQSEVSLGLKILKKE